jgi:hypothetical protein
MHSSGFPVLSQLPLQVLTDGECENSISPSFRRNPKLCKITTLDIPAIHQRNLSKNPHPHGNLVDTLMADNSRFRLLKTVDSMTCTTCISLS